MIEVLLPILVFIAQLSQIRRLFKHVCDVSAHFYFLHERFPVIVGCPPKI